MTRGVLCNWRLACSIKTIGMTSVFTSGFKQKLLSLIFLYFSAEILGEMSNYNVWVENGGLEEVGRQWDALTPDGKHLLGASNSGTDSGICTCDICSWAVGYLDSSSSL